MRVAGKEHEEPSPLLAQLLQGRRRSHRTLRSRVSSVGWSGVGVWDRYGVKRKNSMHAEIG